MMLCVAPACTYARDVQPAMIVPRPRIGTQVGWCGDRPILHGLELEWLELGVPKGRMHQSMPPKAQMHQLV